SAPSHRRRPKLLLIRGLLAASIHWLSRRVARSLGSTRTNDLTGTRVVPLQPLKQRGELRRRELHHAVRDRGPAKLTVFQTLVTQLGMQAFPLLRRGLSG